MKDKIKVEVELPDDFLVNVFVTAMEGGVNYWADVNGYHWKKPGTPADALEYDLEGFGAQLHDVEGAMKYDVNRATIHCGLTLLCGGGPFTKKNGVLPEPGLCGLVSQAVAAGDAGMIDANLADDIVQVGLFGEIVYG